MKLDRLGITKMASGHLCLELSEMISWSAFPEFAEMFLREVGGSLLEKIDTPVLRLWRVTYKDTVLRLVFDDFPVMVSIESDSDEGDRSLQELEWDLKNNQGRLQ